MEKAVDRGWRNAWRSCSLGSPPREVSKSFSFAHEILRNGFHVSYTLHCVRNWQWEVLHGQEYPRSSCRCTWQQTHFNFKLQRAPRYNSLNLTVPYLQPHEHHPKQRLQLLRWFQAWGTKTSPPTVLEILRCWENLTFLTLCCKSRDLKMASLIGNLINVHESKIWELCSYSDLQVNLELKSNSKLFMWLTEKCFI